MGKESACTVEFPSLAVLHELFNEKVYFKEEFFKNVFSIKFAIVSF